MLKNIWKDPVWSKVIATGIITSVITVATYFLDLWPVIKKAIISLITYFGEKTDIPNWLMVLMSICTIIIFIALLFILWQVLFPSKSTSSWKHYNKDNFFNILWHWNYSSDGSIYGLYSLCPNCMFQIYPENESAFRAVSRIMFQCESCGSTLATLEEDKYSLENKVKRLIQQKIRTGRFSIENNT